MSTKKMTLTVLGLGVMLLLAIPTSQGRDIYATEAVISKTDDGVFVGEFEFQRGDGKDAIVVDVYKVFPDNAKSYYYALYNGKKYMIEQVGYSHNYGCYRFTISVNGHIYEIYKRGWE